MPPDQKLYLSEFDFCFCLEVKGIFSFFFLKIDLGFFYGL